MDILNSDTKNKLHNDLLTSVLNLKVNEWASSPKAFMEKFIQLESRNGKMQDFELITVQDEYLNKIQNGGSIILDNAARRVTGMTTLLCAYSLWFVYTHPTQTVFNFSESHFNQRHIKTSILRLHDSLPDFMKMKIVESKMDSILFENGARIEFRSICAEKIRGSMVDLAMIHNFSYDHEMRRLLDALHIRVSDPRLIYLD